jgi:hypothetical protein
MKAEHEESVTLVFKTIGMEKIRIPVKVIYLEDGENITVKYAEAKLPEHAFINKHLLCPELKLLMKCPFRRAA